MRAQNVPGFCMVFPLKSKGMTSRWPFLQSYLRKSTVFVRTPAVRGAVWTSIKWFKHIPSSRAKHKLSEECMIQHVMKVSCKAFLKKSRILTFLSVRTQFGEPFSRWMSIYSFKPRPLCRAKHELPEKYMIVWDIMSVSRRVLLKKNVEF